MQQQRQQQHKKTRHKISPVIVPGFCCAFFPTYILIKKYHCNSKKALTIYHCNSKITTSILFTLLQAPGA